MSTGEKSVIVAGIDESEHSFYALNWKLDNLILQSSSNSAFKLVIVYAKPSPTATVSLAVPAVAEVLPYVESDLKKITGRVLDKAKEICTAKSVTDVTFEAVEGDARNVLCEAVEKHHATMLVVGSYGYGAIKRSYNQELSQESRRTNQRTRSRFAIWVLVKCHKKIKTIKRV